MQLPRFVETQREASSRSGKLFEAFAEKLYTREKVSLISMELKELEELIFCRMATLPESGRQQRAPELLSVSGMPARVDSLQSSMERRYLSGFFLGKHHEGWALVGCMYSSTCTQAG